MAWPMIVGFDPSEKRLGIAVIRADTGVPVRAVTERLDVRGGGWADAQVERAVKDLEHWRLKWGAGEPVAVGIEDAIKGAKFRNALVGAAYTTGVLHTILRRRWPHMGDLLWMFDPHPRGERTTDEAAPWCWKVAADVPWPRGKPEAAARATGFGFELPAKDPQDAADAACIAIAAHRRWRD